MFALGVLSLLQICFLPGFLLVRTLRLNLSSWSSVLVVSFALSLIANYVVIFPLTALGLYVRPVVIAVMLVEVALVVRLIVRHRRAQRMPRLEPAGALERETPAPEAAPALAHNERPPLGRNALAVFVLVVFAYWTVATLVRNVGTVFDVWDAVLRWNPWAESWAAGALPDLTWEYPQLVPANWSISYVLMGASLQFFPKAVMPLFALFVLVLFLDMALRARRIEYVFGFAITCLLLRALLPVYVPSGDMEFAVAFFAFAAVYCLIDAAGRADTRAGQRVIILGAILAGGGAVTKQGGLFMLAAYPLLAYVLCLRGSALTPRARRRLIAACVGCTLVIAAPWYVYTLLRIVFGENDSIVAFLLTGQTLHESRSLAARLAYGIGLIGAKVGAVGLIAIAATLLLGLRDRTSRWITCIVVVPYTLIWGFGFSYSLRNYSVAFPFLGLACGAGVAQVWRLLPGLGAWTMARIDGRLSARASMMLAGVAALLVAAALVVGSIVLTPERMQARQRELMRRTWNPELNAMLYRVAASRPFEGKIITHYEILSVLPELSSHMAERGIISIPEKDYPALLDGTLEPEIKYVLVSSDNYPRLVDAAKAACEAGHCEMVETYKTWSLVRILGEPPGPPSTPEEETPEPSPP
jgi:hypothetical protein